jgi:DNA-binding transcriptional LysR family regulator
MELRHLRYFVAVGEALSFTRAAATLRIAQPALSRQIRDLEDEIGVNLFRRSPRGVTLTSEGKLFLAEAGDLLKRADESVGKVRELAAGRFGDLHVGYASSFTAEIVPPAVAAFEKQFPGVNLVLHDVTRDELVAGLESGALELGIIPVVAPIVGISMETLRTYEFQVALPRGHALARLRAVPLEKVAAHPLIGLRRRDNPGYYQALDRIFRAHHRSYRIALECDTANSLITAIEAGRGIALSIAAFAHISGKRLVFRRLADVSEPFPVGIARATTGDVSPAGEKFCAILRKISRKTASGKQAPGFRLRP